MDRNELYFKVNKLAGIYKREGARYLFTFLWSKLKKKAGRLFFSGKIPLRTYSPAQLREAEKEIAGMVQKPVFSVIMPVYNVDEQWLVKAIESVRNQIYPYWELCIADDASTAVHIRRVLDGYAKEDSRIRVIYRETSGNISAASNSALELAGGEFIALLDHDDELTVDALLENARMINRYPDADLIYSDEDKIDEQGRSFDPRFKPAWSPEHLLSHMYICHLCVCRTSLVKRAGAFRSAYDGAQDYDLVLRITAETNRIYHIPEILYHWRAIRTSTASSPHTKTYAYEAGRKALDQHIVQKGFEATSAETQYFGVYEVRPALTQTPLVSIIIPSAGKMADIHGSRKCLLENCIDSILHKSTYRNVEIIVVDGCDIDGSIIARCEAKGVKMVHCPEPFNFSMRINRGAAVASGEFLLLLNDDTEVISPDWIEQQLVFGLQKDIGIVGAKLVTEDKKIQHAGIILAEGSPSHIHYGVPDVGQGYFNDLSGYKNYLALTAACVLVRTADFQSVHGFDESFPVNFNDVDFCLKLHQKGLRNVFNPHAVLYHFESVTRTKGYKAEELSRFVAKWAGYSPAQKDPYYNPNLLLYPAFLQ
jgi:glycosyltransferase involved in cell wall biosynthesis